MTKGTMAFKGSIHCAAVTSLGESAAKMVHVHGAVPVSKAAPKGGGEDASTVACYSHEEGVLVPFRNQHDAKD